MATNNFTSVNPTGIYAIDLLNDEGAQDDLDLIHENVIRELQGMGLDTREQDCLGSQEGWLFGMVYGVDNGNYEYVTVELQTRNGYYEGANLDYVVGYLVDGVECDDESLEDAYVFNGRKQDYVEISKTRVKRLRAQARAIVKKIDKVYSNNTTVLRKVGQFNNGEAIYESV